MNKVHQSDDKITDTANIFSLARSPTEVQAMKFIFDSSWKHSFDSYGFLNRNGSGVKAMVTNGSAQNFHPSQTQNGNGILPNYS